MNITHATEENIQPNLLKQIFDRQKELMDKYHYIEERSGLLQTTDCPVNLDDRRGQALIKDFSWRVTEELGEALDALGQDDMEHFAEELVDGLHFLTELTILAGLDWDDLLPLDVMYSNTASRANDGLDQRVYDYVEGIGMMCNCLKNKPWKQSMMQTDRVAFFARLHSVWARYIAIMETVFESPEDIASVYLKKSQVNKFRQRSNY
jgi:hypothetical protein